MTWLEKDNRRDATAENRRRKLAETKIDKGSRL
jgi:hypothetical protein